MMFVIYFVGCDESDAMRRGPFTKFSEAADFQMSDGYSHKMYSVGIYVGDLKEVLW